MSMIFFSTVHRIIRLLVEYVVVPVNKTGHPTIEEETKKDSDMA